MKDDMIWTFSQAEKEMYIKQRDLCNFRMAQAEDALDYYSDHGLDHVHEVMEQSELLFEALRAWISELAPGEKPDRLKTHLLLGARLHDIGMCGTEPMRVLLAATDRAHAAVVGASSRSAVEQALQDMLDASKTADFSCRAIRDAEYALRHRNWQNAALAQKLCDVHEDVKKQIRKSHAANSGEWILDNREMLSSLFGRSVNLFLLALLAAFHSGSSLGSRRVIPGQSEDAVLVRRYAQELAERHDIPWREGSEASDSVLHSAIVLTPLLRLADNRRSGDRLHSLDGAPLKLSLNPEGMEVVRVYEGLERPVTVPLGKEILAGELCTRFGGVRLSREGNDWLLTHEFTLLYTDREQMRGIMIGRRLPNYSSELTTSLFGPDCGMKHCLSLKLTDTPQDEAKALLREWNGIAQHWCGGGSDLCPLGYIRIAPQD